MSQVTPVGRGQIVAQVTPEHTGGPRFCKTFSGTMLVTYPEHRIKDRLGLLYFMAHCYSTAWNITHLAHRKRSPNLIHHPAPRHEVPGPAGSHPSSSGTHRQLLEVVLSKETLVFWLLQVNKSCMHDPLSWFSYHVGVTTM